MIRYYFENDPGNADDWPEWEEVTENMFCTLANAYEVDNAESLWRVEVYQDSDNNGLRLMLKAK